MRLVAFPTKKQSRIENKVSYSIIIPSRYNSTRLPGKPLLDINGKSLLQHVYECAAKSTASEVIVATDDERIKDVANGFGARVCMTRTDHLSGTDRLAEVVDQLDIGDDEIIVNLQGDEPLMPANLLDQVAKSLESSSSAAISTLCEPIESLKNVFDPNIVKVVVDHSGHALYFSRAAVPWVRGSYDHNSRNEGEAIENCFRHVGIYAYRAIFLKKYPHLSICQIEQQEALEQLRAMYHGYRIKVDIAKGSAGIGVDTVADLEKARQLCQ